MTTLCALHHDGETWIGSDTMICNGHRSVGQTPKWVIREGWAIGVAGCVRTQNLLNQESIDFSMTDPFSLCERLKTMLVDDDYAKRNVLPDGFLKKISEEKSLSSEKKYGDAFQFVSRALPIICSNHWPKTSDLSDAIRERALVFPFEHRIAGRDKDDRRRDAMMRELPGILNRFIKGIKRLNQGASQI